MYREREDRVRVVIRRESEKVGDRNGGEMWMATPSRERHDKDKDNNSGEGDEGTTRKFSSNSTREKTSGGDE